MTDGWQSGGSRQGIGSGDYPTPPYEPSSSAQWGQPQYPHQPQRQVLYPQPYGTAAPPRRMSTARTVLAVAGSVLLFIAGCLVLSHAVSCGRESGSSPSANPAATGQPDTGAFIADMGVTDDDIRILRGLDGHLFDIWLDASVPAGGSRDPIRPDDYLARLEDTRQWPGKDTGWDTDDASGDNPRVIARISRLARDELTSARGGEWAVIGFDYPTGSYSPFYVPVGEDAYVSVTMRRTSGDSKGEVAEVRHYRWRDDMFDTGNTLVTAADVARNAEIRERIASLPSIGGRETLLSRDGRCIYVMEGEADASEGYPLRQQEVLDAILDGIAGCDVEIPKDIFQSDTVLLHILSHDDSVRLSYAGGRTAGMTMAEARDLMDTGQYIVDLPSSNVVAKIRTGSEGRTTELLARPCEGKEAAETFLGRGLDVPETVCDEEPYLWETIESESWGGDGEANPPMVLVRYGTEENPVAVIVVGDAPLVESTCEKAVIPRNDYNRNRKVPIIHGRRRRRRHPDGHRRGDPPQVAAPRMAISPSTVPSPRHSETKSARRDKKPRRADACNRGKGMKKRGYESSPVMTTSMSRSMCP